MAEEGEEEPAEIEAPPPPPVPNPLTPETIAECLCDIQKTPDDTGYAFTKLDCTGRILTELGGMVEECVHLRRIVLCQNRIGDLKPVSRLPNVIALEADKNDVENLDCMGEEGALPWCQILNVPYNQVEHLPCLQNMLRLRVLNLAGNRLAALDGFGGHSVIECLNLTENKLESLAGLGRMPSLKELSVAGNSLVSFVGLLAPSLEVLTASANRISNMDGVEGAPKLREFDLSGNQLTNDEDMLEVRKCGKENLPALEKISLRENPMCDALADGYRVEIAICLPSLPILDDEEVTPEEKEAAEAKVKQREEEREAARLAAEEAAKAEAEAAAAAAAEEA